MYAQAYNPMLPVPHRIQRLRRETKDTFTLELSSTARVNPPFLPGQFNMLYLFGVGEVPISISGDPAQPELLVHTTRAVGVVTKAMAKLKMGQMIGVRGPYGTAWPAEVAQGNDVVLIAGGIGLAPLRPLIYKVLTNRERYGRVLLLYGTRSPEEILYRKEVETWRSRFDMEVLVTVDRAIGNWHGHVGVVTKILQHAPFDPYHAKAYVCGPEIMMTASMDALVKRGVTKDNIYVSMERNMKCAIGQCGHCQFGPKFACKDGPVFRSDTISRYLAVREV